MHQSRSSLIGHWPAELKTPFLQALEPKGQDGNDIKIKVNTSEVSPSSSSEEKGAFLLKQEYGDENSYFNTGHQPHNIILKRKECIFTLD